MPNPIIYSPSASGSRVRPAEDHPQQPAAQRRRSEAGPSSAPGGQLEGLPARSSGPTLPLTTARAQIWQWARQPDLLIDNPDGFERTGAQRLDTPQAAASLPTPVVHDLMLPSALPIPDMPRVRLPEGERADVAAARRLVVDWLVELRQTSADLHAEGASPDDEADAMRKLDILAMPSIVAALNAEKPGLQLVYAHTFAQGDRHIKDRSGDGSVNWDAFVQDIRPGRWQILMDNDAHGVALDMAVVHVPGEDKPRASVLMLNPAESPVNTRAGQVAELADQLRLPANWTLLVAEVAAQKSDRSCKIFSLSMALKCATGTFDHLHMARLNNEPVALHLQDIDAALARPDPADSADDSYSNGYDDSDADSDADSVDRRPRERGEPSVPAGPTILGQEVLHASQLVGPQFMKHAQSRADVKSYIAMRGPTAQVPVNSQGQSLLQRHEAHRVARWPAPPPPGYSRKNDGSMQIYSASIELKRISFLDKAIRHAAACGPDEVQALAGAMQKVDTGWRDRFA